MIFLSDRITARLGVWEISGDGPQRIPASDVDLESNLEKWIARDPDLVQAGLVVIGQQIYVDGNRARLDLLALDPQGRWVVIEIKKGVLSRETIAQVIDYTACLSSITEDRIETILDTSRFGHQKNLRELLKERDALESLDPASRELSMIVVGTGRTPELDNMANFLSNKYGFPLTVVTFHVFTGSNGTQMLVRELSEPEHDRYTQHSKAGSTPTVNELQQLAEQNGIGDNFKALRKAAEEAGFYARPWKTSVMYAPQSNKTRCLYTTWVNPVENKIRVYIVVSAFTEFYQIPKEKVEEVLGQDRWHYFGDEEVERFTAGLKELIKPEIVPD